MGFTSVWHWVIVLVVILIIFGAGKLPSVMGDVAKGVKAFKAGMKQDPAAEPNTAERAEAERVAVERAADERAAEAETRPDPSVITKT